jgi:hypothetical protein
MTAVDHHGQVIRTPSPRPLRAALRRPPRACRAIPVRTRALPTAGRARIGLHVSMSGSPTFGAPHEASFVGSASIPPTPGHLDVGLLVRDGEELSMTGMVCNWRLAQRLSDRALGRVQHSPATRPPGVTVGSSCRSALSQPHDLLGGWDGERRADLAERRGREMRSGHRPRGERRKKPARARRQGQRGQEGRGKSQHCRAHGDEAGTLTVGGPHGTGRVGFLTQAGRTRTAIGVPTKPVSWGIPPGNWWRWARESLVLPDPQRTLPTRPRASACYRTAARGDFSRSGGFATASQFLNEGHPLLPAAVVYTRSGRGLSAGAGW